MAIIHSTYTANTGTGTATSVTITGIIVPSVVDGLAVACFGDGDPTFSGTFGAGGAQSLVNVITQANGVNSLRGGLLFLPRPDVGTYDLTLALGGTHRGGVMAVLIEGSKTTGYSFGAFGGSAFNTNWVGIITNGTAFDLQLNVACYANRDTVGGPLTTTNAVSLLNTAVNSGGGASSYGFLVSGGPSGSGFSQGWTFGTNAGGSFAGMGVANYAFNTPGLVTIRHAP